MGGHDDWLVVLLLRHLHLAPHLGISSSLGTDFQGDVEGFERWEWKGGSDQVVIDRDRDERDETG